MTLLDGMTSFIPNQGQGLGLHEVSANCMALVPFSSGAGGKGWGLRILNQFGGRAVGQRGV